jgi:polyisoprenyl-phosphate glycosyltransferase
MRSDEVILSVVLPMRDEEELIASVVQTVRSELEKTSRSFEIVCVDDGSRDATLDRLEEQAKQDSRVIVVPLSRNFGKESAMAAGLAVSTGSAVVIMDADLQHPPDVIHEMLARWDEGYDVVNAVKERRGREGVVYRAMAWLFNRMMAGASGGSFRGASDFKLLDRQVVDAIVELPERNRFFRGLVTWVGYRTAEVSFHVAERVGGRTKWSLPGLVRYSIRNLLAFSALPLKTVAALGFTTLVFAAALVIQTMYRYFRGQALSGFTTVILLQLILGGLLLTSIGVIALYLSSVFEEVKQRPMFIVRRPRPGRRDNRASGSPGDTS